jgi:putative glutamine amidotransferase
MNKTPVKPLIGVPADVKEITGQPFHAVGDKYLRAITLAAGGLPFVIPAFGELYDLPDLVRRLDGVMLTGSPSNVHPTHYGVVPTPEAEPHDEARDATTLPLIHEVLKQGIPMLAICRGMQELNVALGGSLHARVHELPDRLDHRRPATLTVNSLHWQALDRVAPGLQVEAEAPDGTIEAVSVRGAKDFALGVQWHPEYRVLDDVFSTKLFAAFGVAARRRAEARVNGESVVNRVPGTELTA